MPYSITSNLIDEDYDNLKSFIETKEFTTATLMTVCSLFDTIEDRIDKIFQVMDRSSTFGYGYCDSWTIDNYEIVALVVNDNGDLMKIRIPQEVLLDDTHFNKFAENEKRKELEEKIAEEKRFKLKQQLEEEKERRLYESLKRKFES